VRREDADRLASEKAPAGLFFRKEAPHEVDRRLGPGLDLRLQISRLLVLKLFSGTDLLPGPIRIFGPLSRAARTSVRCRRAPH